MSKVTLLEVLNYSSPQQTRLTIQRTIPLIVNRIKTLTGKDCNNIITGEYILSLQNLRQCIRIIDRILYTINPNYRLDVNIQYIPDSNEIKLQKKFYLSQAIKELKALHSSGYAYGNAQLSNFIITENKIVLHEENKMKFKDKSILKGAIKNDFEVLEIDINELVINDNDHLSYLLELLPKGL